MAGTVVAGGLPVGTAVAGGLPVGTAVGEDWSVFQASKTWGEVSGRQCSACVWGKEGFAARTTTMTTTQDINSNPGWDFWTKEGLDNEDNYNT